MHIDGHLFRGPNPKVIFSPLAYTRDLAAIWGDLESGLRWVRLAAQCVDGSAPCLCVGDGGISVNGGMAGKVAAGQTQLYDPGVLDCST